MLHWPAEILMPWCFDAMCRWRVVMVVNFLSQSTTGQKWLFDPTTCLSWCSRKPVLDRKVFEHKEHVSSFCWGCCFGRGWDLVFLLFSLPCRFKPNMLACTRFFCGTALPRCSVAIWLAIFGMSWFPVAAASFFSKQNIYNFQVSIACSPLKWCEIHKTRRAPEANESTNIQATPLSKASLLSFALSWPNLLGDLRWGRLGLHFCCFRK